MRHPRPTTSPVRRSVGWAGLLAAAALTLSLTACGSEPVGVGAQTPAPSGAAPSSAVPSSSSSPTDAPSSSTSTPADAVVIDISLLNGQVTPNGTKIDVRRGQTVVLNVTSDHADEVHVHGDYDVEISVGAGDSANASFVADQAGSVEVESHEPQKIIAILNIR